MTNPPSGTYFSTVTLSTLYIIFIVLWKGWADMEPEVRANRLLLPGYALCILLAWQQRGRSDWHKGKSGSESFFECTWPV